MAEMEQLKGKVEELERHNLTLNENIKNCAQLIKLTQAFAEVSLPSSSPNSPGDLGPKEGRIRHATLGSVDEYAGAATASGARQGGR